MYFVPADAADDFYDAWRKYADDVDKEKDNDVYTLKKVRCLVLFQLRVCVFCVGLSIKRETARDARRPRSPPPN